MAGRSKQEFEWMSMLLPLFALMAPLVLWSFEMLVGYPVVIEELVKLVLVSVLIAQRRSSSAFQAWLIGMLYGLSEAAIYLMNISMLGSSLSLWLRLGLTMPMHGLTALVIYIAVKRSGVRGVGLGLFLGIVIHKLFNILTLSI